MRRTARVSLLAATLLAAPPLAAQSWPAKSVRVIVPYPVGGTTDLMARVAQPKLNAALGQPIIVENRAGANGVVGAEIVARAAPDGYTLMLTTSATNTMVQHTAKSLPYDPIKDFTPIVATGRSRGYIMMHPAVPVNNLKELIDYARKFPGKLAYGTPNISSSFHLSGSLIAEAANINLLHVPYKGGSEVMRALVTGEIPMAILSNGSGMTSIVANKVKLVAVLDNDRDPKFPNIVAVPEMYPEFERTADWTGVFGPSGMLPALVQRVNREINAAFNAPDSVEKLANVGLIPLNTTAEEFTKMIARAVEVNRKGVRAAGIKPE